MSDNRTAGRAVLNWRGPLLASAIFAGVFAILLIMAHQNESNMSDPGSSFRQDPYGTSLLFDAYQRAGYQVERSQDENSLADQNAPQTTAFFIGGPSYDDVVVEDKQIEFGEKFRGRLEGFLARGGRAVLIETNDAIGFKSSQGWEFRTESRQGSQPSGPHGPFPVRTQCRMGARECTSQPIHRGSKLTRNGRHSIQDRKTPSMDLWRTHPRMAGPGACLYGDAIGWRGRIDSGKPGVFSSKRTHQNASESGATRFSGGRALNDLGGRNTAWIAGGRRRALARSAIPTPVRASPFLGHIACAALEYERRFGATSRADYAAEILHHGEHAGVAAQRLLRRSLTNDQVIAECWEQFRRRSVPDAQAISL